MPFEPANDFSEEFLGAEELRLELRHTLFDGASALAVLRDLALLVEVPEQAHMISRCEE
jgi:hypothetical protein